MHGLWSDGLSWNYPSWSTSTEFFTYLLFPFAALAIVRSRAIMLAAIFAVLFGALAWLAYDCGGLNIVVGPAFVRCLLEFLLGALLYQWHRSGRLDGVLRRDAAFVASAASVILMMHYDVADIVIVPAFMALILAGVRNDGRVTRVLNTRPLVWLGDVSFSMYMVHGVVEEMSHSLFVALTGSPVGIAFGPAASWGMAAFLVGVVLLIAHFTYRHVEIPARRYLNGGRRPPGRGSPGTRGRPIGWLRA